MRPDEVEHGAHALVWRLPESTAQLLKEENRTLCGSEHEHRVDVGDIHTLVEQVDRKDCAERSGREVAQSLVAVLGGSFAEDGYCGDPVFGEFPRHEACVLAADTESEAAHSARIDEAPNLIDHLSGPNVVAGVDVAQRGRVVTDAAAPRNVAQGQYTRAEILAAFSGGLGVKLPSWREGVRYLPDARCDLLAFTLDKTNGNFSPTTRYRDYAISPTRIHWESQSGTREGSPTGQRYQWHQSRNHSILLFARLRQEDRAFWFLGPARYRGHTSERPMAVTWELDHPLSGDLFTAFAAAVA